LIGVSIEEVSQKINMPLFEFTSALFLPEIAVSSRKRSAQQGAAYFVPKDKIGQIVTFVADMLEAGGKNKNPWVRWFERLSSTFDTIFTGLNWREREKEFWDMVR
jgi:hypothetical protein